MTRANPVTTSTFASSLRLGACGGQAEAGGAVSIRNVRRPIASVNAPEFSAASLLGAANLMLFLLLAFVVGITRAAEPVGMVLDVVGPVQFIKPATQDVTMFTALQPGAEVGLGRGAKLVATLYAKGAELSFTGPARLHVKAGSIDIVYGAKPQERLLQAQQVQASTQGIARRQQQAAISMRNLDPMVAPAHQSAVRETNPEFVFSSNLEGLFLGVYDQEGHLVAKEKLRAGGSQRLGSERALKRGESYVWTILEDDDTPKTPTRKTFRVLHEDEVRLADSSRPTSSASVAQWALYAGLLENLWLRAEAKVIWVRLSQERPGDPMLARFAH